MDKLVVEKKDGRTEDFDRSKILSSVVHAGASPEEAEGVAVQVESWLATEKGEEPVPSSEIREKVSFFLGQLNKEAATNYLAFSK